MDSEDGKRGQKIEKDHNDEKVMREVKSISNVILIRERIVRIEKNRRYRPPAY